MGLQNPYQKYKQNSIMTATPQELVLLLYNGAMKFLKQAILHLENKDIPKAHSAIIRVQNITLEFMATVDRNYEVGENLYNLYDYMYNRLIQANISKEAKMLQEVYDMYKELRDTWEEAMKIAKKGK
ncbi:flagellar export chaperone FliS [Paramaledivibacter caminithermalis]|uniref:Flagellar secretion chaperone FliS n=1 Tax=Paramaledivibacter caminithermalis (strain DSM 15212 / CIP 107654 / DViRD3) TaxID=1121301 RepID=A0A1M6L7I1_PARC5|nr:flagellar export chaperone FliS [Paramaledivibacter caminithermalis]SHJ67145.1 flagellar protein FliS [Paramaledivibacter caminithermalis DSM 15212]